MDAIFVCGLCLFELAPLKQRNRSVTDFGWNKWVNSFFENFFMPHDLQYIADYIMPAFPACTSDLGFIFGTRHGVKEFCEAAYIFWQKGMFGHLLVSGGRTGNFSLSEADVIAEELVRLGMPKSVLILETEATNTGENVQLGRAKVADVIGLDEIRSVVVIGKVCSTRRYLMTIQKHWPGMRLSVYPVNYFGVPAEDWHKNEEFRSRVLNEFEKIPRYLSQGFLEELDAAPIRQRTAADIQTGACQGSCRLDHAAICRV